MSNEKQTGSAPRATGARPEPDVCKHCGEEIRLIDGEWIHPDSHNSCATGSTKAEPMGTPATGAREAAEECVKAFVAADFTHLALSDYKCKWAVRIIEEAIAACQSAAPAPKCPLCMSTDLTLHPGDGTGRCDACGIGGSYGSFFFPAPAGGERLQDLEKAAALLDDFYAKWEDGDSCYEDPEEMAGYMGHAVDLGEKEEEIIAVLNRLFPQKPEPPQGAGEPQGQHFAKMHMREAEEAASLASAPDETRAGTDCTCGAGNDADLRCHADTCALAIYAQPKCPRCNYPAAAPPSEAVRAARILRFLEAHLGGNKPDDVLREPHRYGKDHVELCKLIVELRAVARAEKALEGKGE